MKKSRKTFSTKRPRGNCYVCVEALYHCLGGRAAGLTPHVVKHEGDTHWYLVLNVKTGASSLGMGGVEHDEYQQVIIDPTVSQFKTKPPYHLGRGCGFLTKFPSKRAKALMEVMIWQK